MRCMTASLQDNPQLISLLVFTPCMVTYHSKWSWSVWSIEHRTVDGISVPKWNYKRYSHMSTQSLCWIIFFEESQLYVIRSLWRDPTGKELTPQAISLLDKHSLNTNHLVPFKLSDKWVSSQQFSCYIMKDLRQYHTTVKYFSQCLKLPSFEAICYAVT